MICQLWDKTNAVSHGLYTKQGHMVFSWRGNVFFSCSRRGNAMEIHIASTRKGKSMLRQAVNAICQYIKMTYDWCEVIIGNIKNGLKSVQNLATKCGFIQIGSVPGVSGVFAKWVDH